MTSIHNMNFANWLQEEMVKRNWSQSDLARAADLSRAVINKLVNHKTYPQPTTLEAIARAFKIPTEAAYRTAGLLSKVPASKAFEDDIIHKLSLIKDPQRRATAIRILNALVEEESEQSTHHES